MQFGFSYVGLVYLLMLFIPNIIWVKNQPKDYDKYVVNESRILLIFERIGEVAVCISVLIFSNYNIGTVNGWSLVLVFSFLLMLLYEVYWIKYFRSAKEMSDFYSSLIGVPVAGATLPVAAFLALGIYEKNPLLAVASIVLGIGHIGIHMQHKREIG